MVKGRHVEEDTSETDHVPSSWQQAAKGAIMGARERQEDCAAIVPITLGGGDQAELLILADGMGGHARGDVAAQTAVTVFGEAFQDAAGPLQDRLRTALAAANSAIGAAIERDQQLQGMGCTLIGAVIADGAISWTSVGDSPLFICTDHGLRLLNQLHSIGAQVDREAAMGLCSATEAMNNPQRHMLLSALTGGAIPMVDEGTQRIDAGSVVLLASDGIETLPRERIAAVAGSASAPDALISLMLSAITDIMKPDQDNTTIIATRVHGARSIGLFRSLGMDGRMRRRALTALAILLLIASTAILTSIAWMLFGSTDRPSAPPAKANIAAPATATTTPAAAKPDASEAPAPANRYDPMAGFFAAPQSHRQQPPPPEQHNAKPAAPQAPATPPENPKTGAGDPRQHGQGAIATPQAGDPDVLPSKTPDDPAKSQKTTPATPAKQSGTGKDNL